MKQKIAKFSVILNSQHTNSVENTQKIDKYSEKFLTLLQNILEEGLRSNETPNYILNTSRNLQISQELKPYCENKHRELLKKLDIKEDDSGLSDMEDEIYNTCQRGIFTSFKDEVVKPVVKKEIFCVSKEPQLPKKKNQNPPIIQTGVLMDISMEKETEKSITEQEFIKNLPEIKNFEKYIEQEQSSSIYQPFCNNPITCSDVLSEICKQESITKSTSEMMEIETEHGEFIKNEENNNTNMCINLNSIKNPLPIKKCKIDPLYDPSSNLNSYRKPFVPKINKNQEKLKNKVPFLKDFNPQFLKKENIDKKILRKFRNYVKSVYKTNNEIFSLGKIFWKNFISSNLLPPMKYVENGSPLEFKSFNTKYLLWLFSKQGAVQLYKEFAEKYGEEIMHDFISSYDLVNVDNNEEPGILEKLKYYVFNLHSIYSNTGSYHHLETDTDLSMTIKLPTIFEGYNGFSGEINKNFNTAFFFEQHQSLPRRCGKYFHEQFRNEEDEYFTWNKFDSGNVSFESIQSVE
jgi:hypothetical protein